MKLFSWPPARVHVVPIAKSGALLKMCSSQAATSDAKGTGTAAARQHSPKTSISQSLEALRVGQVRRF